MSKGRKAKKEERAEQKRLRGRNHRRRTDYKPGKKDGKGDKKPLVAGTATPKTAKANGKFSGTGLTKAQKARKGQGRPADGGCVRRSWFD